MGPVESREERLFALMVAFLNRFEELSRDERVRRYPGLQAVYRRPHGRLLRYLASQLAIAGC